MKVLNLYAGIGGNRKLWQDVEVTAVEYNEEIAGIYKDHFPNDTVVVGDAHQYLLDHYKEFDFIWSSPPCQSHSRMRLPGAISGMLKPLYPDMKLWQEIIFLQRFAVCKYVVENVNPYYDVFIPASIELQRHLFWSNFTIRPHELAATDIKVRFSKRTDNYYGFNLDKYKIKHRKDTIFRNCVNPDLGLYILEQARGIIRIENTNQLKLAI